MGEAGEVIFYWPNEIEDFLLEEDFLLAKRGFEPGESFGRSHMAKH